MVQGRMVWRAAMARIMKGALLLCVALVAAQVCAAPDTSAGNFDMGKVHSALAASGATVDTAASGAVVQPAPRNTVSAALVFLRLIGYLAVLLALLVAIMWGVKKIGLAGKSKLGGGSMDIVEALPLGQGKNIMLVRVLDKVYLLGQTSQQVTLLATFEGQQALSLIAQKGDIVPLSQFKDVFHSFMEKFKKS